MSVPAPTTDWLLVRAWVEPDHPRPLRITIRRRGTARTDAAPDAAFLDPDDAAAYVGRWLTAFASDAEEARRGSAPPEAPGDR